MSSTHLTKLKRKATELEQKKQFDKALALYIQVIEEAGRDLDDADLQLFNRVGDLLLRQGNTSEALAYYEKAVDMYAERGFLNNAIALCNKILRQSPARTAVYYKLGKISASKGFRSDARKNFLEYADRMQKGGNLDEAFRALKEFADLCPDQDDVRLMLADLLTKENRTDEALEQLHQLYAKLDAEGRLPEARATMDRIKAIDPEAAKKEVTGNWKAQKSNDLVFLDLGEPDPRPARAATPPHLTPATPQKPVTPVETIDVSGVGALQGLAITFLPDENEFVDPPPAPLEGLELVAPGDVTNDPLPPLDLESLVTAESLVPGEMVPVDELIVEGGAFEAPDEIVVPVDGLARPVTTLTGSHPSLAPLIEEPPLTGSEFGDLELVPTHDGEEHRRPHDLAIESSLPLLSGPAFDEPAPPSTSQESFEIAVPRLGDDETPDEWVNAALQGNRDDLSLDRLLTPLDNRAVTDEAPLGDLELAGPDDIVVPGADAVTSRITGSFSVDELLELPPEASAPPLDESAFVLPDTAAEADATRDQEDTPADAEAVDEPFTVDQESVDLLEVELSDIEPIDATGEQASVPDESPIELPSGPSGTMHPAWDAEGLLSPEFALEASGGDSPAAPDSALDTASLRAEVEARHESGESVAQGEVDAPTASEDAMRRAFEEDRVELPLLDLEAAAFADDEEQALKPGTWSEANFESTSEELQDLLSSPATFGDGGEPVGFEPAPLDLAASGTTDEWGAPEVLIDGEWRDEHVGDLVSGEVFVVGDHRNHPPRAAFDDLAAAMLYDPDGARQGATPTATPTASSSGTPRSTLSFGGTEAQLRRRLELSPGDTALRRQLGEALLDVGQREEGLNELEHAVTEFETRNQFDLARDIVDVILRVVPLSVRHHQKRVEYAVRASDRPRLVEAYTELADSLFRCGEPEKASVVYSRVLELAPENERARFALSMLANDAGTPRSSDDVPVIPTGILHGTPSLTMASLTPEALDALTAHDIEAPAPLPYLESEPESLIVAEEPASDVSAWQEPEGLERPSDPEADLDVGDALPHIETVETTHEALIEEISEPAPEATSNDLDEEVDEAFAAAPPDVRNAIRKSAELMAIEEWAADQQAPPPSASPEPPPAPSNDFIDLGDWLRADEPEKSTRMVARDVAPTGDEVADFAEMLRRFKQGVAANVEDEDFDSHYDLGVAFKEMGLIDEAIAQFQKALRGAQHRVRAYEALGHCFVEQGQFQVAIALLQRAAEVPGADDQELVGVLYLLGFACESTGRQVDAVGYYQRVFAVDIQFRDVSHRLANLARPPK